METSRKDVLYVFFFLLALISYEQFLANKSKEAYWRTLGLFCLSLLSKSTAITLTPVLLLLDIFHNKDNKP